MRRNTMEEKEEGISLGEIFHVIFIKKWLLLAITVVIMLFGVIFVQALYNPKKVEYTATFEIRYPNSETNRYPDGTEFLYKEFISLENLSKAKAKDESFSKIDIEKMQKRNDISISENYMTINNAPVKTGTFTIKILKKYFESSEQAVDFFQTLISIPAEYIREKSKNIEYDRYLKQFNTVGDYVSQVDSLIKQKNLIIDDYDRLIEKYSNAISIKLEDGATKTIIEAQNEIESYFNFYNLESMKTEVELNGYINPESDYLSSIKNQIDTLNRNKEENEKKIEALYAEIAHLRETLAGTVTDMAFQEMFSSIAELSQKNVEIDHMIEVVYQAYLIGSEKEDYPAKLEEFKERLNTHYTKLQEFTKYYQGFNNEIYELNTKLLFTDGSTILQNGGINILIALVAFLVIGFVLGCCLNLVLDLPKYLKEKKKASSSLEEQKEPVEGIE